MVQSNHSETTGDKQKLDPRHPDNDCGGDLKTDVFAHTDFKKSFTQFHEVDYTQDHQFRRRVILEKYPEVRKLYGNEPMTFVWSVLMVAFQFTAAYYCSKIESSFWYWMAVYWISGTVSHSLHVMMHDTTHDLCFKSRTLNNLTAIMINLGQGVPSSISFKRYHSDHHAYMGVSGVDPDLPSPWEIKCGRFRIFKVIWMMSMPFFYAIRPLLFQPKNPSFWEFLNFICVVSSNYLVFKYWGLAGFMYIVVGNIFGMSLHPSGSHLIAEHLEFFQGLETYSYYGFYNFFLFNVGYHREHHDFPQVAWSRLPEVTKTCPEYYNLPSHFNYLAVFWYFLVDPKMGPWSRIVRSKDVLLKSGDSKKTQ